MRRSAVLLAALALAACQPKPLPEAARTVAKTPSARPSTAVKVEPPQLLQAAPDTQALEGQVALDATYATAHGATSLGATVGVDGVSASGTSLVNPAGQIVAQGAGNVIVPAGLIGNDGASLIGNDGGSLITNDGGGLITNDGAGLAVDQGNAIISRDGAGLITNDGGSLINNGGSTLIGNDGGSLIGNDGGGYHLAAAATTVPLGQQLPVGGAQVAVRSLATGLLLPIGQDAAGKPVTTVASNRQGRFELYPPADAGLVVVETAFRTTDGKVLAYGTLADTSTGSCQVDEDTQLVTRFLITAYASRIAMLMTTPPEQLAKNRDLTPFVEIVKPFHDYAMGLNAKQVQAACLRAAGLLLSKPASLNHVPVYDLAVINPDRLAVAKQRNQDRRLASGKDVIVDVFGSVRHALVTRLRKQDQPEAYFDGLPQVQAYRNTLDPSFKFRYTTDFLRFVVNAYLTSGLEDAQGITLAERNRFEGIQALLEGLPVDPTVFYPDKYLGLFPFNMDRAMPPALSENGDLGKDGVPEAETLRLRTGVRAVSVALLELLFLQEESTALRDQLMEILKAQAGT